MMKETKEHVATLRYMLSVLMVRQSAWQLSDEERKNMKQGIAALQAAVDAINVQIHA